LFLFFLFANNSKAQLNISPVTSNYPGGYNITCHGATDGWIDVLVDGGTPPYWFYWSNGSFNQNLDNLAAGNYTVIVADMNNLVDSITVTLYEPNEINIQLEPRVYEGGYNISEAGQSNGMIECHVSGGVQDYSYLWNTNSTEYKIEDIPAGSYSVIVTDMNMCSSSASITLIEPSPLHITSLTSPLHHGYNLSCKNSEDGAIIIAVAGGTGPYTFHWFNSSYSIDVQNPTGLKAGHYSVIVTDANDISIGGQITLTEPVEFLVSSITPSVYPPQNKNLSCSTCSNGSLTVNLTGGIGNKKYQWVDQSTNQSLGQTAQTATNLSAGTYLVIVTDTNGCIASGSHSIIAPDRDDWSMAGNAGTNPTAHFIGTIDSTDLVFKTKNTEGLRLKANGNIVSPLLSGSDYDILMVGPTGKLLRVNSGGNIINDPGPQPPVQIGCFAWNTCGNILQIGNFLGSKNNIDLVFKTNNLEKMRLNVNGNLGIGDFNSNAPQAKLQINHNDNNGGIILNRISGTTGHSEIQFNQNGTEKWAIGNDLGSNRNFFIWNHERFVTGHRGEALVINDQNWVGIDIAQPTAKLHVNGDFKAVQNGSNKIECGSYDASAAELWCGNSLFGYGLGVDAAGTGHIYGSNTQSMMTFTRDGAVGINIDPYSIVNRDPNRYRLYVDGGIAAREIKVTASNFPDYVFHKEYSLMTIYALKIFIQENEHLPDVPSAKEVNAANGFEVGKFQTMLLMKIEEQALYIISLQEQIDAIKAELINKLK
jgi:hypothetical protein